MSPKSTSAMSPSETRCEKPMPRPAAQSTIEVTTAPDWATKATRPFGAAMCRKLALSPTPGTAMPRQFGPQMRIKCGLRAVEHGLAARVARFVGPLAETGRDDHRGARAALGQVRYQPRHGVGRRRDDREVGGRGEPCHVGCAGAPLDLDLVRVDEADRAGEPARDQVPRHHGADRAWPLARANQRHRARPEHRVEVADGHDKNSPPIRYPPPQPSPSRGRGRTRRPVGPSLSPARCRRRIAASHQRSLPP